MPFNSPSLVFANGFIPSGKEDEEAKKAKKPKAHEYIGDCFGCQHEVVVGIKYSIHTILPALVGVFVLRMLVHNGHFGTNEAVGGND